MRVLRFVAAVVRFVVRVCFARSPSDLTSQGSAVVLRPVLELCAARNWLGGHSPRCPTVLFVWEDHRRPRDRRRMAVEAVAACFGSSAVSAFSPTFSGDFLDALPPSCKEGWAHVESSRCVG